MKFGFLGAVLAVLFLAATAMLAQSQHVTMLQAQGEYYADCSHVAEWPLARTYVDLTGMDRGTLVVSATGVEGAPTLLLYYRSPGDSTWSSSGLSVTVAASGFARGAIGRLPAPMSGPVELSIWTGGTGGVLFPLSIAAIFSQ